MKKFFILSFLFVSLCLPLSSQHYSCNTATLLEHVEEEEDWAEMGTELSQNVFIVSDSKVIWSASGDEVFFKIKEKKPLKNGLEYVTIGKGNSTVVFYISEESVIMTFLDSYKLRAIVFKIAEKY